MQCNWDMHRETHEIMIARENGGVPTIGDCTQQHINRRCVEAFGSERIMESGRLVVIMNRDVNAIEEVHASLNEFERMRVANAREQFLPYWAGQESVAVDYEPLPLIEQLLFSAAEMLWLPAQGKRPNGCVDENSHARRRRLSSL